MSCAAHHTRLTSLATLHEEGIATTIVSGDAKSEVPFVVFVEHTSGLYSVLRIPDRAGTVALVPSEVSMNAHERRLVVLGPVSGVDPIVTSALTDH